MVFTLVILFALVAISIASYRSFKREQALEASPISGKQSYQLKLEKLQVPSGIYFSPTHSWAHLQPNGAARLGIDSFIQGLTGVLTSVSVPETGSQIKQGDPVFTLHHKGKHLTITAPVSGRVKGLNQRAIEDMYMIHQDPYKHGWLIEIEPENWESETRLLYLGNRTITWMKTELSKIKDFFAHSLAPQHSQNGLVTLQDGGEIAEAALAYQGKGMWGSFQTLILDHANQDLQRST